MVFMSAMDLDEGVHVLDDHDTGLNGVIAIHSTALGPAAGGCRVWEYSDQAELVTDAIRLARGMSYKNALAGLPFGGGKAVLMRPSGDFDRAAFFRAFGSSVAKLDGRYITAEDVGTTVADMRMVRDRTRFVAGLEKNGSAAGGDPSPWTAKGVYESMKMAAQGVLQLNLKDAKVAIQGVGSVGAGLARLLAAEGAHLVVADVDEARAAGIAYELGALHVGADELLGVETDILAPCALGAVLNDMTVPSLKTRLICGAANNQLEHDRHGEDLRLRGIVYTPDYVVNAGGIINVAAEYLGETTSDVRKRVGQIAPRLMRILHEAGEQGVATNVFADNLARTTISEMRTCAA
ncbi:Leucine dehydrogenase [Novosphingobium resinovorum]|uniref:Leucine dehydrogenase n=1 Tax=Novosphingobium resinovorum TaxID=158500 RepID=A0A031JSJ4_9SPHN|nr:Glu/Leu/Phe/Val dehydrogenase dimerization domain-containing protein [Novosphingobium resinovorum]EZP79317.1 Leucine dehydrogenase [Novosphingobium resinovorum]